jgi:hypothetical protein
MNHDFQTFAFAKVCCLAHGLRLRRGHKGGPSSVGPHSGPTVPSGNYMDSFFHVSLSFRTVCHTVHRLPEPFGIWKDFPQKIGGNYI